MVYQSSCFLSANGDSKDAQRVWAVSVESKPMLAKFGHHMRTRRAKLCQVDWLPGYFTSLFSSSSTLAASCLTKITTAEVNHREDITHLKVGFNEFKYHFELTIVQEVPHKAKGVTTPNSRSNRTRVGPGTVVNPSTLREVTNLNPSPTPSMCELLLSPY